MSQKNPFDQFMEMGQAWASSMSSGMEDFIPEGFENFVPTFSAEVMEQWAGKGVSPDGLDAKTRLLLMLAGLVSTGAKSETQIKVAVRQLIAADATKQEIAETIAQSSIFGGVSAMTKAMQVAMSQWDETKGDS